MEKPNYVSDHTHACFIFIDHPNLDTINTTYENHPLRYILCNCVSQRMELPKTTLFANGFLFPISAFYI